MARVALRKESVQARIALDSRLHEMKEASKMLSRPRNGWIQAIRVALGMSATDLSRRLGVGPSSILRLEASELQGGVKLETLARVADALDCDFVYAFIPKQSLQISVKQRALAVVRRRLAGTQQSMALEKQALKQEVLERLMDSQAEDLMRTQKLWWDDVDAG